MKTDKQKANDNYFTISELYRDIDYLKILTLKSASALEKLAAEIQSISSMLYGFKRADMIDTVSDEELIILTSFKEQLLLRIEAEKTNYIFSIELMPILMKLNIPRNL